MSDLFWCIAGIIGGALVSFIISAIFFFVGLKRKRISCEFRTFCIYSNKFIGIEGLEVKYHSNKIDNLYSSTMIIKNTGNSIIENSDFSQSHALSATTTGKFLTDISYTKIISSNKLNNAHLHFEVDDKNTCNCISIVFDFLSKNDELYCTFFHTGQASPICILKEGKVLYNNCYMNGFSFSNREYGQEQGLIKDGKTQYANAMFSRQNKQS